jgi:putative SOS response-associated peptidase YedK
MCGRFTQTNSDEVVATLLQRILGRVTWQLDGADADRQIPLDPPQVMAPTPRDNVAPTEPISIITWEGGAARRRVARWGMLRGGRPRPGQRPQDPARRPINARVETAHRLPTFRDAWARRRCLIIADGWYEWQKVAGRRRKQPWLLRPLQGDEDTRGPFAMAGLWSIAELPRLDGPGHFATAAIVTTAPAADIAHVHDRMPLVLPEGAARVWLQEGDAPGGAAMTAACHGLTFCATGVRP